VKPRSGSAQPGTARPKTRRVFTTTPPAPYSLEHTVARLVRFSEAVDRWGNGFYTRLLLARSLPVLVRISQEGPPSRARLRVELFGRGASHADGGGAARRLLERALGAGTDVRPFYRAVRSDPILAPAVRAFRGLRIAGCANLFEAIVTAIVAQQVNLAFAYSIRDELIRALGQRMRWQGGTYYAFPTPDRVASETLPSLRRFRLSRAKAATILSLAQQFASAELSEQELDALPDDEIIERLTALKGIGRWTAETALLRGLGRLDAFPAADLGVVKYLAQGLLGRPSRATEAEMRALAERWRPYRGLALVYAYAELARR
jgi:DNA-3-methyladenine glycosylase II